MGVRMKEDGWTGRIRRSRGWEGHTRGRECIGNDRKNRTEG